MALGLESPLKKCPSVVVVIIVIIIIVFIYLKTNVSRNKNNLVIFGHLICQTGSGWQEELKRLFQRISLVTFLELWNFHRIRRRWYQFDQIKQIKQPFSAEVIGGISTKSLMSRYIHNYGNRSSTTGNSVLSTLHHFWFKYPNIWFVTIIRLRKYQLCFFFV